MLVSLVNGDILIALDLRYRLQDIVCMLKLLKNMPLIDRLRSLISLHKEIVEGKGLDMFTKIGYTFSELMQALSYFCLDAQAL